MSKIPEVILGVSFGHGDSSAALVVNGTLVAAAEEERFTRVKHDARFPESAIQYCLNHASLSPSRVEAVAIARKPTNALFKKVALGLQHPQLFRSGRAKSATPKLSLNEELERLQLRHARLYRVEHHLAHLLSVRFLAEGDDLALMSFDGLGDFVSTMIARPKDAGVEVLGRVHFPHSLGFFYTAMTHFLGFPYFGDEFKVMGLSSYGSPRYLEPLREIVRVAPQGFGFELNLEAIPILRHPMKFSIVNNQPQVEPFYNANFLTQLIGVGPRRKKDPLTEQHWDLAKSVQACFEEVGYTLLGRLHEIAGGSTLALAGGCAHNSVWVGKIPKHTPYKKVVVAPASHDAGIAVGAAAHVLAGRLQVEGHSALLGPSEQDFAADLHAAPPTQTFSNESKLIRWMVDELAAGKVFGLFQGRMEFGPRALGSRSIIADPRPAEMRDRLNSRVKHRESFRPFAASVLWEEQKSWFLDSFYSPTMEAVFEVRSNMRKKIAAVVHVDHTCRIQSVTKDTQPFYWKLIEQFKHRTGVPMLLNTSFNDSEPIVCSPRDAIRCFQETEIDHLVIGLQVYSRERQLTTLAG